MQASSRYPLPKSYLALCAQQNGGFLKRYCYDTTEPTSDGLDYVECHYLAGLAKADEPFIQIPNLPDYLVPFSQNDTQLFAFDYQHSMEPIIRYVDIEVDQWLTLAPDFNTFLASLTKHPLTIPADITDVHWTPLQRQHYFLLAEGDELDQMLTVYESVSDKEWYCDWLLYFAQHGNLAQQTSALKAFNTQQLYFRRQLPLAKKTALLQSFQNQPQLKSLLTAYQQHWS